MSKGKHNVVCNVFQFLIQASFFTFHSHRKLYTILYSILDYYKNVALYVQDPHKAVVQVGVDRLHVVQGDGFTQQLFIEGQSEASVYVVTMEHRHPHDTPDEVKV